MFQNTSKYRKERESDIVTPKIFSSDIGQGMSSPIKRCLLEQSPLFSMLYGSAMKLTGMEVDNK